MAYEKQTWVCGETITAEKLNHIEDGIEECCGSGGGTDVLEVNITFDWNVGEGEWVIDKTYAEVLSAIQNNQRVSAYAFWTEDSENGSSVTQWSLVNATYWVTATGNDEGIMFRGIAIDGSDDTTVWKSFYYSANGMLQEGNSPIVVNS